MSNANDTRRLLEHNAVAHDRGAASYDSRHTEIYNPIEQQRLLGTIAELLAIASRPDPQVLDVGAGTGNLSRKFLAAGCRVCAADVSEESLALLEQKAQRPATLSTAAIRDERLPFPDAAFDVVAIYSVLHHVPDYLLAVREMVRVLRPGGLLYIDHESNEEAWQESTALAQYRAMSAVTLPEHLWSLLRTGEAFTPGFAKTVFRKAFVNRRYEREGDLHVWPDDHIEWDKIAVALEEGGARIIRSEDYLLYRPRGGEALYARYRDRCTDMKFIFARKRG